MQCGRSTFRSLALQGLIIILIFLIFLPVLQCGFVSWDDDYHLYENRAVETLDGEHLKLMFLGHVKGAYLPLTFLSYAVEKHFFGLTPWVYHLNNVLIHLAIVLLIVRLGALCGLSLPGRLMAALIFGIHPMHGESVIWVTERKDVLYTFFYLLSLIAYCYYIRTNKFSLWAGSLLFALLSVLAKPMALSLPLILCLMDWYFNRPLSRKLIFEKIPFLLVWTVAWISFSMVHVEMFRLSKDAVLVFFWVLSFYIEKFIFPVGLAPLYTLPEPIAVSNPVYMTAVLIVIGFIGSIILLRKNRWFIFGVLYFLLSIFFLLRVSDKTLGPLFVANHYMYLPSLGFCFALGAAFDQYLKIGFKSRLIQSIVGILIFLALMAMGLSTRRQISGWKNDAVFWDLMVEKNPSLALPYLNRGVVFARSGRYREALTDLNRAVALKGDYPEALNSRGNVYGILGDHKSSVADYTKAIALQKESCVKEACDPVLSRVSSRIFHEVSKQNSYLANYYANRGAAYLAQKSLLPALDDLQEAQKLNPFLYEAYVNSGLVYKELNQPGLAMAQWNKAIQLNPGSATAYLHRVSLYYQRGEWYSALNDLDKILIINKEDPQAYYFRSRIFSAKGDYVSAYENLLKAMSLGYSVSEEELSRLRAVLKR